MAFQQYPLPIAWMVRSDGQLVGCTLDRDQDVIGFHRHILGGAFGDGSAVVESVDVCPFGSVEDVWVVVKRTINGQTKRYIEYMTELFDADDTVGCHFVDSGLQYSGSATTTLTGLGHLEGETVSVLVNGSPITDRVVAGGSITVPEATTATVGFGYASTMKTLRIEAGGADGPAQGKKKRVHSLVVRLLNTVGLEYGPSEDDLYEFDFHQGGDPMDSPIPLFTGDIKLDYHGDYETDGRVVIRQSAPIPMTIAGIMPRMVTYD